MVAAHHDLGGASLLSLWLEQLTDIFGDNSKVFNGIFQDNVRVVVH